MSNATELAKQLAGHPLGSLVVALFAVCGGALAVRQGGDGIVLVCATICGVLVGFTSLRGLASWALLQYVAQCRRSDMADPIASYDPRRRAVLLVAEGRGNGVPPGIVGTLAVRPYEGAAEGPTAELKRVSTRADARGCGVASALIAAGESWAIDHGYREIVLTTSSFQPAALTLYARRGYREVPHLRQPFSGIGWCGAIRHHFTKALRA